MPLASALTGDWRPADPLIAAGADVADRRIVERASVELITERDARRRTDPANSDVALTTGAPPTATRAESLTGRGDPPALWLTAALVIGGEAVDPLITRRSAGAVCALAAVPVVVPVAAIDDVSPAMRITRDGSDTETRRAGAS